MTWQHKDDIHTQKLIVSLARSQIQDNRTKIHCISNEYMDSQLKIQHYLQWLKMKTETFMCNNNKIYRICMYAENYTQMMKLNTKKRHIYLACIQRPKIVQMSILPIFFTQFNQNHSKIFFCRQKEDHSKILGKAKKLEELKQFWKKDQSSQGPRIEPLLKLCTQCRVWLRFSLSLSLWPSLRLCYL